MAAENVMNDTQTDNPHNDDYDQLVAYLDGELDTETSEDVERRLKQDPDYRHDLKMLQRSWDLLDELPRAEVSETFTQTTVEMVVLSAAHELKEKETGAKRRQRTVWVGSVLSLLVLAVASYFGVSAWLNRPNDQLLSDLPVIEDIELYRVADSVEFLTQLQEAGVFSEEEIEDGM